MSSAITEKIKQRALQLGYASCGIIPAAVFNEYKQYLDERISTFPASKDCYMPMYDFVTPPESAKSIIVCIQPYSQYKVPAGLKGLVGKHYLFDGRLKYSNEYRAGAEFEAYIKTLGINMVECPVPVRWAAAKAGLGKFGRNNFTYSPEHGSYIIVATWVVDKVLEYDRASEDIYLPECGDGCEKCVRACPTKAFSGGFSMDMSRCVAHITFSAEDNPDEETRSQMGRWLYGCDVCQDCCPANKGKLTQSEEYPLLGQYGEYMRPENILTMDEDTYINIVNPRFWYGGKKALWRWKCNALRSLINSGKEEYHQLIKDCCNNEDSRISELAHWGCRKLGISM